MSQPIVIAISASSTHSFSKENMDVIELVEGHGVRGDAHYGKTVKHRSRVRKDPSQPNLRQVHLIHQELIDELNDQGLKIQPGNMGENITTKNIDLLNLPTDTRLHIGESAIIRITGLRNPCNQLNNFQEGLMQAVLDKDKDGNLIRKSGVMGVVETGGTIKAGDLIEVDFPEKPYSSLQPV